jgi:hypothetical protein
LLLISSTLVPQDATGHPVGITLLALTKVLLLLLLGVVVVCFALAPGGGGVVDLLPQSKRAGGQDPASCLGVSGSQSALAASAGDPTRSGWLQTLMMRKMTMTIHIPFLLPVLFGWLHLLHSPSVLFLFQVWGLPLKG